jgi:Zn-dependent peptidase ImmA (M78 family)
MVQRQVKEAEANLFGRCLLMPEPLVRSWMVGKDMDDVQLLPRFCLRFQVPLTQAMVRLVELGYCGKTTLLNPG